MTKPWWSTAAAMADERHADWRVEWVHHQRAWAEDDANVMHMLLGQMTAETDEEVLEIRTEEGMVATIEGRAAVHAYCEHDVMPSEAAWVERVVHTMEDHRDLYAVRWISTVREESKMAFNEEAQRAWGETPKFYAWMHRRIYRDLADKNITYEILAVRESTDAVTVFREANTFTQPMHFHIFMTRAGTAGTVGNANDHKVFLERHATLLSWLLRDPTPMTLEDQTRVVASYEKLIATVLSSRDDAKSFFAPKPMTLEQRHWTTPGKHYGVLSVLSGYAVTEKADGERMLLFVDEAGEAFLINNTKEVRRTRRKVNGKAMGLSLLDGEFVPAMQWQGKGVAHDLFLVFDAYFVGGKPVYERPLLSEKATVADRMTAAAAVIDGLDVGPSDLEVRAKAHIAANGDAMKKVCRDILASVPNKDYDVDGLIFTPTDLPVFGVYPNQKVEVPWTFRWDRVFKWKPPDQNTIDFLVKDTRATWTCPTTRRRYRIFDLYTGYNAQQWEAMDVVKGLNAVYGNAAPASSGTAAYRARKFEPLMYGHPEAHQFYAAAPFQAGNGDVIADNTIVEFAYDMREAALGLPPALRWQPTRVREDKTRLLHTTKSMSRTANDLVVAASVWQTIHEPLTRQMMTGDAVVPEAAVPTDLEERMLGSNDVYYARDIARNSMLSVHMLNFHNHGIKHMLYDRIPKKDALLELACGMGGDLPRWRRHGFKFVLGMDLVRANIVRPVDGAYARLVKQRAEVARYSRQGDRGGGGYPRVVFVIGDCAKPIATGEASEKVDEASVEVLRALYDGAVPKSLSVLQRWGLAGRAKRGFTGVSCQFAIHYFFKTRHMLNAFLENVASNLVAGGAFVCTFMDGQTVHAMLDAEASEATGDAVIGRKENAVVWAITRRYEAFNAQDAFGKVIDVYLENTRKEIPEFLVHLNVLKEVAAEHGLVLSDTGMFDETFHQLRGSKQLERDLSKMAFDEVQKKFSFLNRWAMFTRGA